MKNREIILMLGVSMSTSTVFNQRNQSIRFKKSVFFNKKSFSSTKKTQDPDISVLFNGASFKNNIENYQKNYNNLMTKSYLQKIYKVPQHIISNKEKILMAAHYEEPKIILSCSFFIIDYIKTQ